MKAMTIGAAIKERRLASPTPTQREFADVIGIEPSALSRYETGKSEVPSEVRKQIERALGLSPGRLLIDAGEVAEIDQPQSFPPVLSGVDDKLARQLTQIESALLTDQFNALMKSVIRARPK
jgi:transcriptional regulator with XRE-family HTH domain